MDDLVVIILTLIIAAFGLFGQMKKKKQSQPVKEGAQDQPENIWDMIQREMNPVPPIPQVEMEVDEEPGPKITYNFEPKNEGSSEIDEKEVTEKPVIKYRKLSGEGFSLRKAVIYSEILNRKYL